MTAARAAWATDAALARMRRMWEAGVTMSAMARQLGVTKNAVVGMVHKLDLTARPSPIKRNASAPAHQPGPTRKAEPPLPVLAASARPPMQPRPVIAAPIRKPPPPVERFRRIEPCCWVTAMGVKGRAALYCGADTMPCLPYCPEHAAAAYPAIKQRQREQSAGAGG